MEHIHYRTEPAQWRVIRRNNADHRHGALCGNGSAHYKGSRDWKKVSCPACLQSPHRKLIERA